MKNLVLKYIDDNKRQLLDTLFELIALQSADGQPTEAQTYVKDTLEKLGFSTDCFRQQPGIENLPDYCPYNFEYSDGAYNVAGVLESGQETRPSLMLFAHIDTEAENYFGDIADIRRPCAENGKIYGLGAADDKSGIAMMLCAAEAVLKFYKKLPYKLTLMSIMGKHGGAFGTLSALKKGYGGENSVYLHPAETGHGFAEIKNISLGVVDIDVCVKGALGAAHDDLDGGINAAVILSKAAVHLAAYGEKMRQKYRFDFGSFSGQPSFIMSVGEIKAGGSYGGIPTSGTLKARARFYKPLSVCEVFEDAKEYLLSSLAADGVDTTLVDIKMGEMRATPAAIDSEDDFVRLIKRSITEQTGITEFIHQYHGGSDIRLPILYGDSRCVGIGPSCTLPQAGSGETEWISLSDYINGVKIVASLLCDYMEG